MASQGTSKSDAVAAYAVATLSSRGLIDVVRLQKSDGYITQQQLQADITAALKRKGGRVQMSVLQARLD
eukprot:7771-Heterococcus_DN1.PRE.6